MPMLSQSQACTVGNHSPITTKTVISIFFRFRRILLLLRGVTGLWFLRSGLAKACLRTLVLSLDGRPILHRRT